MTEPAEFGLELRRMRERRGLSLDQLAECTKISASLFAGLERGDLSRWPSGIFRRAFVRSYAQAVGLDPEETVCRFLRLYPDGEEDGQPVAQPAAPAVAASDAPVPRLVLDHVEPPTGKQRRVLRRLGAAAIDIGLAALPALAVALLLGREWFWLVGAVAGLGGHLLVFSLTGTTPGAWLLLRPVAPPVVVVTATAAQARRRAEPEPPAVPATRRRQTRHASGARPVPTARPHRIQH